MPDVFKIIKSIQKIDRKVLPHAEKNILISIAIHLGEKGHIWPSNEQMGERIGESKDYVKNLLMRLKNKKFINIEGRGKSRKIYLVVETVFGNSQLPNHSNSNFQLPDSNSQLPNSALPIKIKEKKNSKEKLLPQGISFENYFKKLPNGIAGKIRKADVKYYWDRGFEDDLIRASSGLDKMPENEQILIFQGIINAFKRKLPMKYEQINIDQKSEYDIVWADAAKNNGDLLNGIGTRLN